MTTALDTLLDHTRRQRDQAQAVLAATQQRLARVQEQGRQLDDYRDECRRNGPTQPGRVVGIDALRAQQALLERIDQALAQNVRQFATLDDELRRHQQAVVALELRAASIEQLLARRHAMQRLAAERRDQRTADESTLARAHAARATRGAISAHPMPAEDALP
jgi:flagellar export protein FliJ